METYTPTYKKIKEGYISYTNTDGRWEPEYYGGFELVNDRPVQVKFTKKEIKDRIKKLKAMGCDVTFAEISTYNVEDSKDAELIDPVKHDTICT